MTDLELLTQLKNAYHAVIMGKSVSAVTKDGRKVEYNAANLEQLKIEIANLERTLGQGGRMGPAGLR